MPLVAAAILPHGWNLIPELDESADGALATVAGMRRVGEAFRSAGVEAIVLAGPHGTRVTNQMCIMDVGRAAGSITLNGKTVDLNVSVDRQLVHSIAAASSDHGVPNALAGFGGNRPDQAVAPLDWGGFVPLWFLGTGTPHEQGIGTVLSPAPQEEAFPRSSSLRRRGVCPERNTSSLDAQSARQSRLIPGKSVLSHPVIGPMYTRRRVPTATIQSRRKWTRRSWTRSSPTPCIR